MLADAVVVYSDRQWCGIILWGIGGDRIAWLEVYEMCPVADRKLRIENLRRWEALSSELENRD